jgi:hypothetical protein
MTLTPEQPSVEHPPARLLWIVGEEHVGAWTTAAEWLHVNAHIATGLGRQLGHQPDADRPCDACWRAAAYAVKGVLLAGYQKTTNVSQEG